MGASIIPSRVFHKRLCPKVNSFEYATYYLCLPVQDIEQKKLPSCIAHNRRSWLSFYDSDHGFRDDQSLESWLKSQYQKCGVTKSGVSYLIAMPRILGHVFNPVSFWVTYQPGGEIETVLCEVNNTYGETHSYIVADKDSGKINQEHWYHADKLFHVSPFLERNGQYAFKFQQKDNQILIFIRYYNAGGELVLVTSVKGKVETLSRKSLILANLKTPFLTWRVISLIHWQAFKLFLKGIKFRPKPEQNKQRVTRSFHDL